MKIYQIKLTYQNVGAHVGYYKFKRTANRMKNRLILDPCYAGYVTMEIEEQQVSLKQWLFS